MAKILILNPMTAVSRNVVRDVVYGCWCKGKRIGGGTVPPFNLLVLTSILEKNGFDSDFIDAQAEQIVPARMKSTIGKYAVVVISTSTMSFKEDADYLLELKRANPGLKTVIFGSHPTFMPTYCLAHEGVDFIIKGEPEMVLKVLVLRLVSGEGWDDLKGIGFKNSNGGITINDNYPFIGNLDELPFPDVDLLPKGIDYFNPIVRRMPYITTSTSRGCPGKCTFCTAPYFDGQILRFQSAEYVMSEIEYFVSKGYREIYFRDDTFFVDKKRDYAIFEYIINKKLDITWLANARVSLIDEDTMKLARRSGCHTIKFGIESGVQEILDGMRKGYKLEQAFKVLQWAKKAGIKTHAHTMIGNPGDTRETVEKTINFVLKLDPTTATFGICTPYPGTPLFEVVRAKWPEIGDGSASDLSKLHVEGLFNELYTSLKKEELGKLVRHAYRRFYLRPSYWLKTAYWQLRGVDDIKRLSIAATNVLDFIFTGND